MPTHEEALAQYEDMVYKMAISRAVKCRKPLSYLLVEDLVQEGFIGVMKAVDTWKPEKAKFSTHAYYWAWSYMSRFLEEFSSCVRYPSNYKEFWSGKLPSVRNLDPLALPDLNDKPSNPEKRIPDVMLIQRSFESNVISEERQCLIRKAAKSFCSKLKRKDKVVFMGRLYCDEVLTLQELGDSLGITYNAVWLREAKLRKSFRKYFELFVKRHKLEEVFQ